MIYKGALPKNFDFTKVKEGDTFYSCNLSFNTTIPNIYLIFRHCNLSFATIQPLWDVDNTNNITQVMPPEPTQDELDYIEIEQVVARLGELTLIHPDKVASELKKKQTPERMTQVLSSDGKNVKVEDLSGEWK